MKKTKYVKKIIVGILVVCLSVIGYIYWQNNAIVTTEYSYSNSQISETCNGYTIMQLSDLHNHDYGKIYNRLVGKVKQSQPDVIVFTGDTIDSHKTETEIVLQLIDQLVEIAPLYFIVGNHEGRITDYLEFEAELVARGVHVLRNEIAMLTCGEEEELALLGFDDPAFFTSHEVMLETLADLQEQAGDAFPILLAHRPEYFEMYEYQQVPLVLVGHAHGGQIRLPFTDDGLFAPGQGLFPQLTSGVRTRAGMTMIVSRGLGNSSFPIRVQNRPEIVNVTLSHE
ncbi:MAG: metallophosphoesterase [Culicoidibacterales bacterium]